jgi:hypothetical protein
MLIVIGTVPEAPYHSEKDIVAPEDLPISARMSASLMLAVVPEVPPASMCI